MKYPRNPTVSANWRINGSRSILVVLGTGPHGDAECGFVLGEAVADPAPAAAFFYPRRFTLAGFFLCRWNIRAARVLLWAAAELGNRQSQKKPLGVMPGRLFHCASVSLDQYRCRFDLRSKGAAIVAVGAGLVWFLARVDIAPDGC
jgi:hypothetical protein